MHNHKSRSKKVTIFIRNQKLMTSIKCANVMILRVHSHENYFFKHKLGRVDVLLI